MLHQFCRLCFEASVALKLRAGMAFGRSSTLAHWETRFHKTQETWRIRPTNRKRISEFQRAAKWIRRGGCSPRIGQFTVEFGNRRT